MKPNKKYYTEDYIIACTKFYGIIREDQLKKSIINTIMKPSIYRLLIMSI